MNVTNLSRTSVSASFLFRKNFMWDYVGLAGINWDEQV